MAERTSQNNPIATASQIASGVEALAISWANRQVSSGEDRQGDGNENDMNAKDFANKERSPIEIGFPFHDANQKQIQNCDGELRECWRRARARSSEARLRSEEFI